MGMVIFPDGTTKDHLPKDGHIFRLKELQDIVGGYIELVVTRDGRDMYINEEGKLNGLEQNPAATALVELFAGDYIVGTVIVFTAEETAEQRAYDAEG